MAKFQISVPIRTSGVLREEPYKIQLKNLCFWIGLANPLDVENFSRNIFKICIFCWLREERPSIKDKVKNLIWIVSESIKQLIYPSKYSDVAGNGESVIDTYM